LQQVQASFGAIARPGAFRTFRKVGVDAGGAFSDRAKAEQIRQMLNSKGLRATIQQLN